MSATLSEATGRPYGIQRVCQAWERSRSALYARQTREQQRHKGEDPAAAGGDSGRSRPLAVPGRGPSEGPRAAADLGRDPGRADAGAAGAAGAQAALPAPRPPGRRAGACRDDRHAGAERDVGHRRRAGLHVGRRVGLDLHSGRALERGVCGMARVQGGSRFAALEPIAQGLRRIYGALDADSAQGLALRMDHGSQYLSDHFLNQIRYWGIRPSYGFVEEPETNGSWRSGGIARSRSKRSTGASSRTSRRYAPQ